ncbi:hypothetical protein SAMN04488691_10692 [Haloferax larsenii]|uniref:Uncharacterized protein n=1 Tax=Haloferax larsenii TaxID=302484 RepID=A0A1H7RMQ1_HALLR|nr:hypothetical protein SAMN04488691_10692 [Haloferax larsenii]
MVSKWSVGWERSLVEVGYSGLSTGSVREKCSGYPDMKSYDLDS